MPAARPTDYERIAERFDARYRTYEYRGIESAVVGFLDRRDLAVLEVGCGTGHWLQKMAGRGTPVVGVDPSINMLARAREAAPELTLVRARAEALPLRDASFDRIVCINALHHFSDRGRFFAEARRLLRSGGGVLTIGLDPHAERFGQQLDHWWVYDYFEETHGIDRDRFPAARTIRGEMTKAGFAWTETMEVDHIERLTAARNAWAKGMIDRTFTSQLAVLSDEEFARGVERIRAAEAAAAADGGSLDLLTDLHFFSTVGWV